MLPLWYARLWECLESQIPVAVNSKPSLRLGELWDLFLSTATHLVGLFITNFINLSTDLGGSLIKKNAIDTV